MISPRDQTLLDDIVNGASGDTPAGQLLMQLRVFAARENTSPGLADWVEYELGGYPQDTEVPAYRGVPIRPLGHFVSSTARVENVEISRNSLPASMRDGLLFRRIFDEPIATIEQRAKQEFTSFAWPAEVIPLYRHLVTTGEIAPPIAGPYQLAEVHYQVEGAAFFAIVNAVRTKILDLALLELTTHTAGRSSDRSNEPAPTTVSDSTSRRAPSTVYSPILMSTIGPRPPAVFVGSSSENEDLCRHLQVGLEDAVSCEVTPWTSGVFQASQYTLESLVASARTADFAVLLVTPDDVVTSRDGEPQAAARDNVIFELGLFIGALGRERTFIVADRAGVKLPSDLNGLTWLPYKVRSDGNKRAALNAAILGISEAIKREGRRTTPEVPSAASSSAVDSSPSESRLLKDEIQRLIRDALAQGWTVRTNSDTTLRLLSAKGRRFTFSLDAQDVRATRVRLRSYIGELRGAGLRVNQSVRRPLIPAE